MRFLINSRTPDSRRAAKPGEFLFRLSPPSAACALLTLVASAALLAPAADLYNEPFRPQFHFSPERNWTNDPCGLIYSNGEYHLFFQFNPLGDKWGHMSWGHAMSRDLVHWKQAPVAIAEGEG